MPQLVERPALSRRGFTYNELLVAIAAASLFAQLASSLQPTRLDVNLESAKINQQLIITAVWRYQVAERELPTEAAQLNEYLSIDYSISVDGLIVAKGYAFELVTDPEAIEEQLQRLEMLGEEGRMLAEQFRREDPEYLIVGQPVEPGQTGCSLVYASARILPTEIFDPDCAEIAIEIERRIQAAALLYVGEQLIGNEDLAIEVYPYVSAPEAQQLSFDVFDVDSDDVVSFGDLQKFSTPSLAGFAAADGEFDSDPYVALQELVRYVLDEELKYGAGDEQNDELGVALEDIANGPQATFSSESFGQLIDQLVANEGVANSLASKVRAIEIIQRGSEESNARNRRGRGKTCEQVVKAFRNELRAQTGKSIELYDALLLNALVGVLCEQSETGSE